MNGHKQLNLFLALILLPAAFFIPTQPAATTEINSLSKESRLPEALQGISGATVDWWAAVQEDLHLSGYHATRPIAGITGLSLIPNWWGEGDQEDMFFGSSVASAGDVNGDGYTDVIIGILDYSDGYGAAAVYHGSASGLPPAHSWLVEGNMQFDQFGCSVGTAGDVNGDGYDDIIVGASSYSNVQGGEGAAFVYQGSASGLSLVPNWGDESDKDGARFGTSVSTAGDVNGDGYDDVIVGAPFYKNGQNSEGAAAVYHGSASGLSLVPNWGDEGDQEGAHFGYSVGAAGDINSDGYDDVIVGAPNYTNGQDNEGGAALYYGSAFGLSVVPNWVVESNMPGAEFGISVGTAGDVNGDGYDDVIVGAHYYTNGQADEGGAVVYHGSVSGLSHTPNWGDESNQEGARFGFSVGTAGDVNGDGYADVIVSAITYSNPETLEGAAFVYHGGDDLFHLYLPLVLTGP